MRYFIITIAFLMMGVAVKAQTQAKYEIDESKKTVSVRSNDRHATETVTTPWIFVDRNGNEFPILMSEKGSCFVYKTKKDGSMYKYYLGRETSEEICRKMGREYKGGRS